MPPEEGFIMRPARSAAILLAAAATLCVALMATRPGKADDNDCKVSLSVGLNNTTVGDVKTKYTFGVAANSAESCADVSYTVMITERLPDGSDKKTEMGGGMRVRGQTRIEAMDFETDSKNTVNDFSVAMKSCKVCDAP
jgi:hypothetical protein